jgi:hypothetical protein
LISLELFLIFYLTHLLEAFVRLLSEMIHVFGLEYIVISSLKQELLAEFGDMKLFVQGVS